MRAWFLKLGLVIGGATLLSVPSTSLASKEPFQLDPAILTEVISEPITIPGSALTANIYFSEYGVRYRKVPTIEELFQEYRGGLMTPEREAHYVRVYQIIRAYERKTQQYAGR